MDCFSFMARIGSLLQRIRYWRHGLCADLVHDQAEIDAAAIESLQEEHKTELRLEQETHLKQAARLRETISTLQRSLNHYTEAPLPEVLQELLRPKLAMLPPGAVGKLWWACLQAIRETCVDRTIETEEWSHDRVIELIRVHYPNIDVPAKSDTLYYVPKHKDDIIYMADLTWVRWVPYKTEKWDCEEYTPAFLLELSFQEINARAEVWGGTPIGFHSFSLIPCVDGLVMADMLSMQRCATVPPGLPGYNPVRIIKL